MCLKFSVQFSYCKDNLSFRFVNIFSNNNFYGGINKTYTILPCYQLSTPHSVKAWQLLCPELENSA